MASLVSKALAVLTWPFRALNGGAQDNRISHALSDQGQPPNAQNLWGKDMSEDERDRLDGRR